MPDDLGTALAEADRLLTGTVLTLPGATAAELLAEPFDIVWVDLEHGALGPLDAQEMILGAQAAGAYALVRVPLRASAVTTAMLDAGADGVVFADVRDAGAAAEAARRVKHPPEGTRGWGPRRLALRRRGVGAPAPGPSVWAQIESVEGVKSAEAIAKVDGVDAIVVGTADLSFSVGAPLDNRAPELLTAIAAARQAAAAARIAFGVAAAFDSAPAEFYDGARILVHSTDARLCAAAVDEAADRLRQRAGARR